MDIQFTIDPEKFGYDEAITDPKSPIFKVYKAQCAKGETLVAVLQGKKGVAVLKKGTASEG